MLNIGVILGSVREGRNGEAVAKWMVDFAQKRNDANYELVDLADYPLPLLGAPIEKDQEEKVGETIQAWKDKIASFDGFIIVAPEYNHAVGGALKNALDYLNPELNDKAAGFVGYGSLGGVRAHENLRLILGELQVADVRTAVTFSLMTDFENFSVFKPADYHENNANDMLDQLLKWSGALKAIRA
ncbi:NAD(P)H-dependent FMN reductase [Pelagirhabdus alkalitolerans]|uniref:NAD(P)H-dependent FMN reductase n=1 Tax=Pelagirhabdus alkalitolerans TaxID=1612202 RepID=A0A1G6H6K0_9BACI|nr:NAD(P)H-dependent oxidoreductase [Pelagirhabdus alkalitolerans]SDB89555.1 NAD(P)H-dependent FMN reductase [Pelagirhabdus alkalitolerans]